MVPKRTTRILCALLMLGALVAFTGCGGGDKKSSTDSGSATTLAPATDTTASGGAGGGGTLADYKAGVKQVGQKFNMAQQAGSTKIQAGQTVADKLAGLDALKQSVTGAADDFAALNPPADLKADNDELVKDLRDLASVIDGAVAAAKAKDSQKLIDTSKRLAAAQAKITTTLIRLQTKLGG